MKESHYFTSDFTSTNALQKIFQYVLYLLVVANDSVSHISVKRYIRKGIPSEHRSTVSTILVLVRTLLIHFQIFYAALAAIYSYCFFTHHCLISDHLYLQLLQVSFVMPCFKIHLYNMSIILDHNSNVSGDCNDCADDFQVWMHMSGAEERRLQSPDLYRQLLAGPHEQDLVEVIKIGRLTNSHYQWQP